MAATSQQIKKVVFTGAEDFIDVTFSPTYTVDNVQLGNTTAATGIEVYLKNRTPSGVRVTPSARFVGVVMLILSDCYVAQSVSPPVILSLSSYSGYPDTIVTIAGSGFLSATSVQFGAGVAAFVVINDNVMTATVPAGATTGAVTVVGPGGTGSSLTFTVLTARFRFDLSQGSLPSGLTIARTGGTFYLTRSSTTAVQSTAAALFEDRGDGRGGGFWVFDGYANQITDPFHFTGGNWSNEGTTIVRTAAIGVGPDGATQAEKLRDSDASNAARLYWVGSAPGTRLAGELGTQGSVWVRDSSGDAPTSPGSISSFFSSVLQPNGTGASWRRVRSSWSKSLNAMQPDYLKIFPAGVTYGTNYSIVTDVTATGGIDVWGVQVTAALGDVPLVVGTTSSAVLTADHPENAVQANGDLHIESEFQWDDQDQLASMPVPWELSPYIFSMQTPNGNFGLRYDYYNTVVATVNGSDPDTSGTHYTFTSTHYYNHLFRWEFTNRPSDGVGGYNLWWNGCRYGGAQATHQRWTALPQAVPTSFYLNSNLGAANTAQPALVTMLRSVDQPPSLGRRDVGGDMDACEGVLLGDSVLSPLSPYGMYTGAYIYTVAEGKARRGIVSQADSNQTIVGAKTVWLTRPQRGRSDVKWVIIQLGINDILTGRTEIQMAADLQSLVDDINTNNPAAAVILSPITPVRAILTAPQYTIWQAHNANIAGTGSHNITGTIAARIAPWAALDDGSGNLTAIYDGTNGTTRTNGDHTHPNDTGRINVQAATFRTTLQGLGLL